MCIDAIVYLFDVLVASWAFYGFIRKKKKIELDRFSVSILMAPKCYRMSGPILFAVCVANCGQKFSRGLDTGGS